MRPQVDPSIGGVALQPSARPVDQYYQPEVRMPNNQFSSELRQLAGALGELAPQVRQIGMQNLEVEKDRLSKLAAATALRYKNMTEFRQAVADGKIAESDTPYFMEMVHREVARSEISQLSASLRDDYLKGKAVGADGKPLLHGDDSSAVFNYVRQGIASAYQDAPPSVQAIAHGLADREATQLADYHVGHRSEERLNQGYTVVANNIRDAMNVADSMTDQQPGNMPQLVAGRIQTVIDENGAFLDPTKLNHLVVGAISDAAVKSGSVDFADAVLRSVKVRTPDGERSLRDTAVADDVMSKARDAIIQRQMQAIRYEHAMQEQQDTALQNSALDAIGAGKSPQEVVSMLPGHLGMEVLSKAATASSNWRTIRTNTEADDADKLRSQFIKELGEGGIDQRRMAWYTVAFTSRNRQGDAKELRNMMDELQGTSLPNESNPDVYIGLRQKAALGSLNLVEVAQAANQHLISGRAVNELTDFVLSARGTGGVGSSNDATLLEGWLTADAGGSALANLDNVKAKVAVALSKYQDAVVDWTKKNPNATYDQRREASQKILRAVAEEYTNKPIALIERDMLSAKPDAGSLTGPEAAAGAAADSVPGLQFKTEIPGGSPQSFAQRIVSGLKSTFNPRDGEWGPQNNIVRRSVTGRRYIDMNNPELRGLDNAGWKTFIDKTLTDLRNADGPKVAAKGSQEHSNNVDDALKIVGEIEAESYKPQQDLLKDRLKQYLLSLHDFSVNENTSVGRRIDIRVPTLIADPRTKDGQEMLAQLAVIANMTPEETTKFRDDQQQLAIRLYAERRAVKQPEAVNQQPSTNTPIRDRLRQLSAGS